ncbi:S-adenosyl-L-methionine-dependent methyltransferase [Macrolepiota fuliginosa MF-IS2]|uniref:S-adenosyl-L-methionine-dependent methyltransferase n=1 Tax=Macrolepiota fuliginosa MF-IS2 TaxID=1400762 RepID=A0A9P5XBW1_9AGAR|nr:S-adenosyl-L-methionine-dependent methyltransferase [Macrolepiota fuliginosa MF-IS2]
MDKTPILIAEQLLKIVKRTYGADDVLSGSQLSPSEVHDSKYQIEDLCGQLLRSVLGPLGYTVLLAESCQESSALGFVTALGVPDLLGDDKSMSAQEISDALGVRSKYLKVAMSCLTKHGYFDEAKAHATDVVAYRNNELSSILKESHPSTLKDAVGFICDEGFKATSHLLPASKTTSSGDKDTPAINLAFGFDQSVFEWMSREAWRGRRMGNAMQQLHRVANGNVIFDYEWSKLTSPIVDIGGGIGSLELALAKNRPQDQFQFVIFDIPETTENAKKVWKEQVLPEHSSITFQAGNFMAPAFEETSLPIGKPTYIIRHVLHDWSDEEVLHILKHVRTAMSTHPTDNPTTQSKLILCEMLLHPDSHRFIRTTSMQLLSLNSGLTRTETEMIRLVEEAGFVVIRSHKMRAADTIIEATVPSTR